ncbi:uncharacterized protein [Pocillopora verrucosa]|uniref:uncharacterized protein n=1 Tax=Pocillopora verrucosa TaxID=203993 RepID=UPI00333F8905
MSAIITAVFKATVRWLVDKGRDEAAKKLKDGDVTDQQFRGFIMREIDDLKSKLDGLSRKDLSASIGFFREGIEFLYEVFEEKRSMSEYGADTAQAACAEAVSLAEGMKHLELTESATKQLANAKKRFKRARQMATIVFSNEALSTTDRILAMQYRVMATVLETIDHPADAVASCRVCIEELNSLPVVQQSLQEQLRTGIMAVKGLFSKEERRKVISGVCLVNRVAYDVIQTVHVEKPFTTEPFAKELLPPLSMIDTGKEKVDLLRDRRVRKILCKQGMENCSVSWILGHDGEKKHRLNNPLGIAINSSGQYIVADNFSTIKVYDSSGKFLQCFSLPPLIDDSPKELSIQFGVRLTTDMNDNIYVLVQEISGEYPFWIFKFNKTADHHHKFRVRTMDHKFERCELSVSDSGTVMVLRGNWSEAHIVDVYETDGQFVCSFGEQILTNPCDITTVSDGRVMVVQGDPSRVHILSEQGDHLNTFDLQISMAFSNIAFQRASQHVVVVGDKDYNSDILHIEIYTKDGEFVRSTAVNMGQSYILIGMAVTTEDRIALVTWLDGLGRKVIII